MRRRRLVRAGPELAAAGALLAVWWIATDVIGIPSFLLPTPPSVFAAVAEAAIHGDLLAQLGSTLANLVAGFALGTVIGLAAGFGLARAPAVERALRGPILFLQTAPKIALAPLFLIWFGLGFVSKLALIVSLVIFPVMVATLTGLRSVDRRFGELAHILRLDRWTRFVRIEGPAALPDIFIGLRVGVVQAVVGVILSEWISGQKGLGYVMTYASATYRTPLLFGTVLLASALGILFYATIEATERRLLAWREDT